MKANELRIGNIIKYIDKPIICDINTIYAVSKCVEPTKLYEPIPITFEWLLKSGFTSHSCLPNTWSHCNGLIGYDSFNNCVRVDQTWLGKMPFLHQLQNLYFVITGEELEINL